MQKILATSLAVLAASSALAQTSSTVAVSGTAPAANVSNASFHPNPGVTFAAKSAYVIHTATGTVLVDQNGDQRLAPASLTKMMTLYLTFEALKAGKIKLDTMVPISEAAWKTGGSKMFVKVGEPTPIETLIEGIAIVSGNDGCVAMAEYLGGSVDGFENLMNAKAAQLGMTNTHFDSPDGLPAVDNQPDPNLYSSAHDMALLLTRLFTDFPEYKKYLAMEDFTFHGITQHNRNHLLELNVGIDACKTGHTEEAGYSLASSAVQNGERLVVVVMGTDSAHAREDESLKAYRTFYATNTAINLGSPGKAVVPQVQVWHGDVGTADLTVAKPFQAFLNRADAEKVKVSAVYNKPLVAPLDTTTPVGTITATLPDGQVLSSTLVVAKAIPEAGFGTRWVQTLFYKLGIANK